MIRAQLSSEDKDEIIVTALCCLVTSVIGGAVHVGFSLLRKKLRLDEGERQGN